MTMLAPLRDYLSPKDPKTSPLLCTTKERYFARLSVDINPNEPNFRESQWIISEDVNVEHLLDVFTTIDASSDGVWNACTNFIMHLVSHKGRPIILNPKIEGLPDYHRSKPACLVNLSQLAGLVGNQVERKRLLTWALRIQREREDDHQVARTLRILSDANSQMGLHEEGIQVMKEALEILERLGDTMGRAQCLIELASLLESYKQFDAAGETASRAIDLLPDQGQPFQACNFHHFLGRIHRSKGETEKAILHFVVALEIASSFNWHRLLFWIHYDLAWLFLHEGRFDNAHVHIERAKLCTADNAYDLGRVMELEAWVLCAQHRLEEARSEALRAVNVYEKLGAAEDAEDCRKLLRLIQERSNCLAASG